MQAGLIWLPAGELRRTDIFGWGSERCLFSYHLTVRPIQPVSLTQCDWMGGGGGGQSTAADRMNKSAGREPGKNWR